MSKIFKNQLFIPIAALLLLVLFNLIVDPSFFALSKGVYDGDSILTGNLISIIDNGSELAILAIGMTLVTAASGGQDISVGATMTLAGSVIVKVLRGSETSPVTLHQSIIVAFLVGCLVAILCGAFNGALVAFFKIQPMVATLILFTAGRSIASWVNNNQNIIIKDEKFKYFGYYLPKIPIPTPFIIAIICIIIMALLLKFTTLGLYTQAVGINENSSRLNGINPTLMKFVSFIILGVCVAVAGLIKASRQEGTISYGGFAKYIEMDAILAVALGGNPLGGGKFNMAASIIGAYVIQFLTITLYARGVNPEALPAYKAVVVIILVVISAPTVRDKISSLTKKLRVPKKEVC